MKRYKESIIATRRQFVSGATIAGLEASFMSRHTPLLGAIEFGQAGPGFPSKHRSTEEAVEQAHSILWSKFIDQDGLVLDFIGDLPTPKDCSEGRPNALGWWSPIENGPMLTGLYLPAVCERARRTRSHADRINARRMAHGLIKCASISDVRGFIARGFGSDGRCHYPLGSDDQTHPWFYGLFSYLDSDIPTVDERKQIKVKLVEVATALEETRWNCPGDASFKGQFRGSFTGDTFRDAARYLFMLRGMYELTGDRAWLDRYHKSYDERPEQSSRTRGEICADGADFDPSVPSLWIYVGSQGALAKLAQWEKNESVRSRYGAGLAAGTSRSVSFSRESKRFNNNDAKVFGNADWRAGYPTWFPQRTPEDAIRLSQTGDKAKLGERKSYEQINMRNPLAAAAIIALAGDGRNRQDVEDALRHFDYSKLYLSQFLFAECAYYALPNLGALRE